MDRIATVDDAGEAFEPRMPVTLPQDADAGGGADVAVLARSRWSERPIEAASPSEEYFRQLESAMLDGQVTAEEVSLSKELGDRIEPNERKSVHARIYASVLNEVVSDGRISHREELYLQQVRKLLDGLGWAPRKGAEGARTPSRARARIGRGQNSGLEL